MMLHCKKDRTMRTIPAFLAFCAIAFVTTMAEAQIDKMPREARPVFAVLKAMKASNAKEFRNAYSQRIRDDKNQGDWGKNLKEGQSNLKKLYGDYELKDFGFTFAGDSGKGEVTIVHKGNKSVALEVIKEHGAWKLNER